MEPDMSNNESNNESNNSIGSFLNELINGATNMLENEFIPYIINASSRNTAPFPHMPRELFNVIRNMNNSFGVPTNIENTINNTLNTIPTYKNVLSEKGKGQLQHIKYTTDMKINKCPITQEEFTEGDDVIILPCEHMFSKESITHWLEHEKAICPLCRFELDCVEEKYTATDTATDTATTATDNISNNQQFPSFGQMPQFLRMMNQTQPFIQINSVFPQYQRQQEETYLQQALLNSLTDYKDTSGNG